MPEFANTVSIWPVDAGFHGLSDRRDPRRTCTPESPSGSGGLKPRSQTTGEGQCPRRITSCYRRCRFGGTPFAFAPQPHLCPPKNFDDRIQPNTDPPPQPPPTLPLPTP